MLKYKPGLKYTPGLQYKPGAEVKCSNRSRGFLLEVLRHLVQQEGDWVGWQPSQAPPCCTKCNRPPTNTKPHSLLLNQTCSLENLRHPIFYWCNQVITKFAWNRLHKSRPNEICVCVLNIINTRTVYCIIACAA